MSDSGSRRILVVANNTCPCPDLQGEIATRAARPDAEVLIVAPALNGRIRHWVSDIDEAVRGAEQRLSKVIMELQARGVNARGEVGDADPMLAIEDALATFEADEIIISTYPPGHSNWLEKDLIERARAGVEPTITHVISRHGLEQQAAV